MRAKLQAVSTLLRRWLLRPAQQWLAAAPIGDPVDRRNAPALQVLFLFLTVAIAFAWTFRAATGNLGAVLTLDAMASMALGALSAVCFVLVREGRTQASVWLFVLGFTIAQGIGYGSTGLAAQMSQQSVHSLPMILAGLVIGRKALWTLFGIEILYFALGLLIDVIHARAALASLWVNFISASLSFSVLAALLDRCVTALRESLDESLARERELAAAKARIEQEVAERERVREQLMHSQKMEALGRLAGGISHDFNNLLAVILGHAAIRAKTSDPDAMVQALSGIDSAARRGASLNRKLLAFARHEVTRAEVFDVVAAMREFAPMVNQMLDGRARLTLDLPGQPLYACLDRGQFELVLLNLAANARDAMGETGELTLGVKACACNHGRPAVRVSVRDTGQGVDADVRTRLFEPFFTTKPPGQGTGLGLSVVHSVITEAGGMVEVDSTPGAGAEFSLILPRIEPVAPEQARVGGVSARPRVLLVDDDDDLRPLLALWLEEGECEVTAAASGEEAARLSCEENQPFDVLVTDSLMPGMSGIELAQRVRSCRPDLPVIVMSAYAGKEEDRRIIDQLGADFLAKPFNPERLLNKVNGAVGRIIVVEAAESAQG